MSDELPAATPFRKCSPAARAAIPLFLLVVTSVAYLNADHEEFLFDSAGALIRNPDVRDLRASWSQLWRYPLRPDEQLTRITFAVNYAVNRALGLPFFDITTFLALNVVLHALTAYLIFLLVNSLQRAVDMRWAGWIGIPLALATMFSVHPIHANSVAYIAQRRGILATIFYLLAVLAYLRVRRGEPRRDNCDAPPADETSLASRWPGKRIVLAAVIPVCYWLSCRSKSMGLTLPVSILAIEFCLRAPHRDALRRYIMVLVPASVLAMLGMIAFLWSQGLLDLEQKRIVPYGPEGLWGPWAHFLTEARVFVHYWKLLLLPLPQWCSGDHDFALSNHLFDHYAIVAIGFHVLLLACAVIAAMRRWTLAALGILWFYITVGPYALVPQTELMVEYKLYLPSIGLLLILAEVARRIGARVPAMPMLTIAAVAVGALISTTIKRNVVYQSPVNFWSDAVAKSPNRERCHTAYGNALLAEGRSHEAIEHFEQARRINPELASAYFDLANCLRTLGRIDEAIQNFRLALQVDPKYADAHNNLGSALGSKGLVDEAVTHYEQALRLDRSNSAALTNLGNAIRDNGNLDEALRYYRSAVVADPFDPFAQNALGAALLNAGAFEEAIRAFREAVQLEPGFDDAHYRLAHALIGQGQLDGAMDHLEVAARLRPDSARTFFDWANCLRDLGKVDEAIDKYRAAILIKADFADAHSNLGSALRSKGKLDEAIVHYNEAIRIDPQNSAAFTNLGNALRQQGKSDAGMKALTAAVYADPLDPFARNVLGAALYQEGRISEAIREFREAVRIQPSFSDARFRLALALERQGEPELALSELRALLHLHPYHAGAVKKLRSMLGHLPNSAHLPTEAPREAAKP